MQPLRVQLWSYNYAPEPTGIAPLSEVMAHALQRLGHEVVVVAAHAHYPSPNWGVRRRPYRERRNGVEVYRLPLWVGRANVGERIRQEATFAAGLAAVSPLLPTADVVLAVSPSFPALGPAMIHARLRGLPWILWLQDILPDGAAATGMVRDGALLRAARAFERAAYSSAAHVVVISDSFRDNLAAKGVADTCMTRIYNPASRQIRDDGRPSGDLDPGLALTMGNIGRTQNLRAVVEAFQSDGRLATAGARFVMAGDGVAGDEVRAAIRTERVEVTGILDDVPLERLMMRATVAVVSQEYDGIDFNVPSKLMNFMGYGIPVVAAVRDGSEVARIVREAGCGWVVPSPEAAARCIGDALHDPALAQALGSKGLDFAKQNFAPRSAGEAMERVLADAVAAHRRRR